MVYCGKASQGCQSCRTRRIKCDKLRPDCSQCLRVGKKCPGYRDQLSLMFRDESSKVMQKAHAQWGVDDAQPGSAESSSSKKSSSSISPRSIADRASPSDDLPSPPASHMGSFALTRKPPPSQLPTSINPTLEEQGFQFYVNRYLLGHPDEPRNWEELKGYEWLWNPTLQDVSTALGLAGLSNLREDNELMIVARRRYGQALHTAGELIKSNNAPDIDLTSKLVVMLALFEVVKGTELSTGSIYAHVAGAAALIRSWFPMREAPCGGVRPLLLLCYSTFITAYEVGVPLPPMFNDWVGFCQRIASPEDQPATTLGLLIARFIKTSSSVRFQTLQDETPETEAILKDLIDLEAEFEAWAETVDGPWRYKTEIATNMPPEAVFQGEYHVYHDIWVTRIWNHYRWARILNNQLILDLFDRNPLSTQSLGGNTPGRKLRLVTIQGLSKEILASTPAQWRHPLLKDKDLVCVENQGLTGAGSAGLAVLLFQLKAAVCAPGVPEEYWNWAYGVVACIWGDMGMQHAKSMLDALVAHREGPLKFKPLEALPSPSKT